MTAEDWVDRITRASEAGDDLMSLGEELGKDQTLTEGQYQMVIDGISKRLFANWFATVLESAIEHRPCPPMEFWKQIVLNSRDAELGAATLRALTPWTDVSEFVCTLMDDARRKSSAEVERIAWTTVSLCCTESISIPTGDFTRSRDHIDKDRVRRSILGMLATLRPGSAPTILLHRALRCLRPETRSRE